MYPCGRVTARVVPRVCKPQPSRNFFTSPSFFPHPFGPAAFTNELAPLFRFIDSATADVFPSSRQGGRHQGYRHTFTPRFDVREVGSNYELQGELPGLEQKDLEIEFVDERTLVIRGKTASESTRSNAEETPNPVASNEGDAAASSDNASEKSANYQKPSVEDEEYVDAGAESEGPKTPGSNSSATVAAEQAAKPEADTQKKAAEPSFKYWVSERSVGEFERRFSFPGQVDQEAVKASLRNGILSVVVPKVVAREAKRIQIE
ncbi:hypothetical protein ACLMJK_005901 [Lecanora helva]